MDIVRLTPLTALLLAGAIGCIDRARVNSRCEWSPDTLGALLLSNPQYEQHLARDIELATELAVRYADSFHNGHGGYVEGGRARDRCMASLLSEIAARHEVPREVINKVRARGDRPVEWDVMVVLLFGVVYACISAVITRSISRRFPSDEGWPALAAPAIASLGVSALGLLVFQLWAMILEVVRVGNGHLSGYRASWNPWTDHLITLYIAGVSIFLVIASVRHGHDRLRLDASKHPV